MDLQLKVQLAALAFFFGIGGLFGYLLQVLTWAILSTCTTKVPRPTWTALGMGLLGTFALAFVAVLFSWPLADYLEAHHSGFWLMGAAVTVGIVGATGGACFPIPQNASEKS